MTRHAPNPMRPLALLLAGAGLALNAGAARVGDVVSMDAPAVAAQSSGTWSAADYASARSVTPTVGFLPAQAFDYNAAVSTAATTPVVSSSPALPPTLGARGLQQILPFTSSVDTSGGITPSAVGTGAIQFTSSRVAATAGEEAAWPRSAAGKLYFKIGTGSYMCTASLIKPGIVLTAGHCVHSGNGLASGWYNSFQYIPSFRSGSAPFGTWSSWANVYTTTNWFSGGGGVPNTRDWALIVLNRNASLKRVGDYTGTLGVQYPAMIGKHATVIGYPGNLDSGGVMHRVDSMVNNYGSLNNGIWGSDMQGGSSGGPVVLNYRVNYADSSSLPQDNSANMAVSVVSWGYTNAALKVQGGSQFDSTLGSMLTSACTAYPWAC